MDDIEVSSDCMFPPNNDNYEFDTETSTLYSSSLVNNYNVVADAEERDLWKMKKKTLYTADIAIKLEIIEDPREVTSDEALAFGIKNVN